MQKFTDIGQFREVIRAVKCHTDYKGKDENEVPIYRHDQPYPTLIFRGTVKLHGTNAAIVKYADGHIEYQSRERILELGNDNAAFMLTMMNSNVEKLFEGIEFKESCAIYGEWCGKGIQKGIAISELPKMWVIFAIKVDGVYKDMVDYVYLKNEEKRIFNILQFEYYELAIDFENPEIAQNTLVDYTLKVEEQCPVGKYFGITGIGEGCVWEWLNGEHRYIFKVKGGKHSASKVKKLASVDTEELSNIKEFVEYAVTENRLKQGIDKMIELGNPLNMSSTGDYLRWVYNDVIKEETDTIVKNQIDPKKLGGPISSKARIFWMNHLNKKEY